MLRIACRNHYRRDTAHYASFLPEVNTSALLRKTLVLLIIINLVIKPKSMISDKIYHSRFVECLHTARRNLHRWGMLR